MPEVNLRHRSLLMPTFIETPTVIPTASQKPKEIREHVGRVNTSTDALSIAHMRSPAGWEEPGQRPDFDEYTLVLDGKLQVEHEGGVNEVSAGQAIIAHRGEWVRYSTPHPGGAEYVAICLPAFSPETVNRDD